MMCINDLKIGDKGIIDNLIGTSKLNKRLCALGCIKGTEIILKGKAPLGDPLILSIRGFDVAIRKKDATNILVSGAKEDNYDYNCAIRQS